MNIRARSAFVAASAVVLCMLSACSSDDGKTGTTGTSSSGGGGSSGSGGSCTCNVSLNGVEKSIACGGEACVNGTKYSCSASAEASPGDACDEAPADDGGTSSGCGLFTCKDQSSCSVFGPCMSTSTGTNYCYSQAGSAESCPDGTTATTGLVDGQSRTLCVPADCPMPDEWVP